MSADSVIARVAPAGARATVDDEYWGPIYGPGGPRIRLAVQVAEFVKLVELVDAGQAGFGRSTISRFIDDCGTPVPGKRPPGWKGPWPPRRNGFDPIDLITIGAQLAATSRELGDAELSATTLDGALRLIEQGAEQLRA